MNLENNPNKISTTQSVPSKSHTEGDLASYAAPQLEEYFPRPYDQKDGVIRPLLCDVVDYFLKNNVASENILTACITFLTMNSVSWGYPMAIILKADNRMVVEHLLTVCQEITHEELLIEFQELTSEQLFVNKDDFKNKTIICWNPKNYKNVIKDIQNLISIGYSWVQKVCNSKFGGGFNKFFIKGPNAFIGVEIGDEKFDMNDPSILRLALSTNESQRALTTPGYGKFQSNEKSRDFEKSRIKRLFERLSYKVVDIPYGNHVSSHFMKQQVEDVVLKCIPVQNLLSLLSITNNPPPITEEEGRGYIYGQSPKIFIPMTSGQAITATKVEYYLMKLLYEDIIPLKNEYYFPVQIIVFEAVKRINMGKLSGSTIDKKNEIHVLMTLHKSSNYWAKIGDIFGRVGERKRISIPDIEKELNKLWKLKIITQKKIPQTSDYGYYINYTSIGKHISFLGPSEINDPIFNMIPVQVVNPFTGKIETI
jgi:hypothetical protein